MLKISTRITLWYLSATGLIIILIGSVMYIIYDTQLHKSVDIELEDYSNFLISGLGNRGSTASELYDELLKRKETPLSRPTSHKFVLASNDSVVFERNAIPNIDSLLDDFVEKNEFSYNSKYNTVTLNNVVFRTYSVPIRDNNGQDYELLIFTSLDKIKESLAKLRNILFIITPLSLLAVGIIGFLIARRSFSPVHKITETASKITSSNLHQRVPVGKSADELSELAGTFNDMINRLDLTFQSQKRFIADASHDIRTPLTIVMLELEGLLLKDNIMPHTRETVSRCIGEIQRLNRLIESLLLLARADSEMLTLNLRPMRLDEMIFDSLAVFNNVAKSRNITFDVNIEDDAEILADEDMIKRVLVNILDNAIKYSPDNEPVKVTVRQSDKSVELSVSNKGETIPIGQIDGLFDRFKRNETSRTSEGFGLGLAIVKAIVQAHNGRVAINSDAANGTTVKVLLNR